MFENLETQVTVDEYGASIDDLQFKDIQTIDTKWYVLSFAALLKNCAACFFT